MADILRRFAQQRPLFGEHSASDSDESTSQDFSDSSAPEEYDPFAPLDEDLEMESQAEYDLRESEEEGHERLLASMPDVPSSPPSFTRTYKAMLTGHVSCRTIKGLSFYGTRSEYVMSGSDDGRIYFWNRKTTKLVACLSVSISCKSLALLLSLHVHTLRPLSPSLLPLGQIPA